MFLLFIFCITRGKCPECTEPKIKPCVFGCEEKNNQLTKVDEALDKEKV
jgi:hypothetical protein